MESGPERSFITVAALPRARRRFILPGTMIDEDAELIIALARGDTSALTTLYRRNAPSIAKVVRWILGSDREAEDVVHDVFVEAWEHAGDFDPARGTGRQWLLVRGRSRALDRLRALGRTFPADHAGQSAPVDPDHALDAQRVPRALAQLPPTQRQVVELAYFRGLSAIAIAGVLDIPPGTVKSRLAAGMDRLRAAFDPQKKELVP